MKKISRIAAIVLLVALLCGRDADAAGNITAAYNLEQAQGRAPEIKVYINGKKVNGKNEFSGKVAGVDFKEDRRFVCEDIQQFAKSKEGIHYIVLFDNSRSVDARQFAQAKKELIGLRKSLSAEDRMNLYTVGSDNSRGEKKSIISAKGKENQKQEIKAIQAIGRTKGQTVLYRSLTQVLETADNQELRTVVLLITDGEDDSQGKNNQTYQVNPAVKSSSVPIYGILLKNISRYPNREKMKNTHKNILEEKISRGYYEECNSVRDVTKGFQNIKKILYQDTYVVTFHEESGSNRTTTDGSLSVLCGNQEIKLEKGKFTYNQIGEEDKVAPVIQDIEKSGDNAVRFTIKDDKTDVIWGADNAENYAVKDENGNDWKVDKVNSNTEENTYELIFAEKLYSGEYTIQCSNITDDSQEQNSISEEFHFSFDGLNGTIEEMKDTVKAYWWIGLLAAVVVIGLLVLLVLRKRSGKVVKVDASSLVEADSRMIRLTITDRYGSVKDMEWNVEGSIFVGRSEICDIFFEDDILSKQHFVIEVTKAACYIEDLETTNATFVNGVKITGRRMLSDGDVITAGRERFVFHAGKNGGGDAL